MSNSFPKALRAALEQAGALPALALALENRGLDAIPSDPTERHSFLTEELLDALMGTIHPASAEALVESLLAAEHDSDEGAPPDPEVEGSETRPEDRLSLDLDDLAEPPVRAEVSEDSGNEIITVPPSASEELEGAYDDLVSGAIHLRETPAWGLLRPELAGGTWLIVSVDETLVDMARASAPELTEVLVITSEAELAEGLARPGDHTLVLDGSRPSLSVREVMEHLDSAELSRGFAWRVDADEWARWERVAPDTLHWTTLDAELGVADVVLALGR